MKAAAGMHTATWGMWLMTEGWKVQAKDGPAGDRPSHAGVMIGEVARHGRVRLKEKR